MAMGTTGRTRREASMKRMAVWTGVWLGLLGLPVALQGQGYVGPEEVPYGAGRVLRIMGTGCRWWARSGWIWSGC